MKATEKDLEPLMLKLRAEQDERWKALKSEIHYLGKEAPFWFLIDDPNRIGEIVQLFQRLAADELAKFDETKFELSFSEIRNGKKIIWDVVSNREVRSTPASRKWGTRPHQFSLGDDELFAEYIKRK